jgi:hypothetical protein
LAYKKSFKIMERIYYLCTPKSKYADNLNILNYWVIKRMHTANSGKFRIAIDEGLYK